MLFLVTRTWFRKNSQSSCHWALENLEESCPAPSTQQSNDLSMRVLDTWVGTWWAALLLSPTIEQHLMSSFPKQTCICLKKKQPLGFPAPFLFESATLYSTPLPSLPGCSFQIMQGYCTCIDMGLHACYSFCMQFLSLPSLSGEYLLILFSGSLMSSSIKWQI